MEQLFLMPGQERCERFKDANGAPRVHYSYCSMRGAFFDCESRSLEEAQRPVRGLAGRSGSLLSQLNFGIFDSVCKQRKSLCFPAGDTAGKRRFFSFQLFPQLGTNQFQHAARNAASFIRDQKAIREFLLARVYVCYFEAGRYRVAAAQQSAKNARDLCGHRSDGSICRSDLSDGLSFCYNIADPAYILKHTRCSGMDHALFAIASDDPRDAGVGNG